MKRIINKSVVRVGLTILALVALSAACSGSEDGAADLPESTVPTTEPTTTEPPTTAAEEIAEIEVTEAEPESSGADNDVEAILFDNNFGATIEPIFATNCAVCHNDGGPGSPRWLLATVDDIASESRALADAVRTTTMPPWPASSKSVPFHNDRSLRQDQIDAIVAWEAAGAPVDVDLAAPVVAPGGVLSFADATTSLAPHESFKGSADVIDDYRCLIYDPQLTDESWIRGYNFRPDQTAVVHHAIGYLMPARAMDAALAKSAEDELAGWQCYGSSGLPFPDPILLGWAPGQNPSTYPDGSGVPMDAGDFIVVQIHYHNEIDVPPDASSLELHLVDGQQDLDEIVIAQYVAPAEIPCSSDETGPLCDRDAALAAAKAKFGDRGVQADSINFLCGTSPAAFAGMTDGVASSSCELPIYGYGEIVSILGHEHEIGRTFRMTLNPGESDERILLDIPVWSFDWQYNYMPVEPIMLRPGDTVRIECSWDRALRNPDLEASYVLWADGTNDEMCFSTIATRS